MKLVIVVLATAFLVTSHIAFARIYNEKDFSSLDQFERYQDMIKELRCLVCQNQNLASSDAQLAANLRTIVVEQIEAGETDDAIRTFLVERYGHFVLYDPQFSTTTILLWLGPILILGIGLWRVIVFIRQQGKV